MKQIWLIISLLMAYQLNTMAETNYLHVATKTGWEVINLDMADKMTFQEGNMTVTDVSGAVMGSYPQPALTGMYVDQSPNSNILTSITNTCTDEYEDTFTVSSNGRFIQIQKDGCFEIFTIDGDRILTIEDAMEGQTIDLSALASGVYIYRLGHFAVKSIL